MKNDDILASWKKLNKQIAQLPESRVKALLEIERANKRRPMVLRRLHQRYSALRSKRERTELRKCP